MRDNSNKHLLSLNNILIAAIFSTLFVSSIIFFKTPFEGYSSYLVIIFLLPIFIYKHKFPYQLLLIIIPLFLSGLFSVFVGLNSSGQFIKIWVNVTISAMFYYYIFQAFNRNVKLLFKYYLIGSYIVSLIGIIQIISYFIGFEPGYNFRWIFNKWGYYQGGIGIRLNSVFSEPTYFGASIAPAFFVSMYSVLFKKTNFLKIHQSLIIMAAYVLTFSSVAYLGLFLSIIMLLVNFGFIRYVAVVVPVIILLFSYLYLNVNEFKLRVDGLNDLYSGKTKSAFDVHGSSFVLFDNYHVATENFKRYPLFGTGLGSHAIAYDKYSIVEKYGGIYEFNTSDANSMFLRIMSETGLFGLIFIFLFIYGFFVKRNNTGSNELHWIISAGAFIIIILQLMRQGNYTYNGFLFYMWLYYYNSVAHKKDVIEQTSN